MNVRRPAPSSFSWHNHWACQARWQACERKVFCQSSIWVGGRMGILSVQHDSTRATALKPRLRSNASIPNTPRSTSDPVHSQFAQSDRYNSFTNSFTDAFPTLLLSCGLIANLCACAGRLQYIKVMRRHTQRHWTPARDRGI